jgi:hypothetical protein
LLKNPIVMVEIAARFFESLAMMRKRCAPRHCEERSDEAISSSVICPKAGVGKTNQHLS